MKQYVYQFKKQDSEFPSVNSAWAVLCAALYNFTRYRDVEH